MTIEERLEKLTERHEALTQTVEVLAGMRRKNQERMGQLMDAVTRIVRVPENHQHRLEGLEGGR